MKWLVVLVALGFVALFAFSATLRLLYPYEVEWMEGSMIDHAIRVLHHQPIYTAPTVNFVPWLYTPGYYSAVSWMMHLTGIGFLAGRLVSVLSTLISALIIGIVVWRVTQERMLAFLGAALYIASYHATGYYFDIARNDACFVLTLLLLTLATSYDRSNQSSGFLPALLVILSFVVKQQALLFVVPVAVWFVLRRPKHAVYFVFGVAVWGGLEILFQNTQTNGWFSYYVFDIPSAKGADFSMLHALRIVPDYVLGSFAVASIAVIALILRNGRDREFWRGQTGLLALLWFGSIVAGAMSLGNEGGYRNVMMPFAAFSSIVLPIALADLRYSVRFAGIVWLGFLLQFLALSFDPTGEKMLLAGTKQRTGAAALIDKIRALPGDVYIPYHGYVGPQAGKPAHAHVLATMDVMHMHDSTARRLARDFDSAYANTFSAVILEESKAFDAATLKGYRYAGPLLTTPNVGITRVADDATRPNVLWLRDTISR